MTASADRLHQRNAEIEFLRRYDPALDDPIDPPPPRRHRYRIRKTYRFNKQLRALDHWVRAGFRPSAAPEEW